MQLPKILEKYMQNILYFGVILKPVFCISISKLLHFQKHVTIHAISPYMWVYIIILLSHNKDSGKGEGSKYYKLVLKVTVMLFKVFNVQGLLSKKIPHRGNSKNNVKPPEIEGTTEVIFFHKQNR